MDIVVWAQEAVFIHICIIVIMLDCLGHVSCRRCNWVELPVRTKETLPNFLKWGRVTRYPLVLRELTGGQRSPGKWGVTLEESRVMALVFTLWNMY